MRKHIDILSKLWKQFKAKKLADISEIELSLSTGLTGSGANTSSSGLISEVLQTIK